MEYNYNKYRVKSPVKSFRDLEVYKKTIELSCQNPLTLLNPLFHNQLAGQTQTNPYPHDTPPSFFSLFRHVHIRKQFQTHQKLRFPQQSLSASSLAILVSSFSNICQLFQKVLNIHQHHKAPMSAKDNVTCPQCFSSNIKKEGKRKNKLQVIQKYSCKDCKKNFTSKIIAKKSYPANIVLNVLSYYNIGNSCQLLCQLRAKRSSGKFRPKSFFLQFIM